jgi:carbonic anhydrase
VISSKLLGTKEFFVIHPTNGGMEFFADEVMRGPLVRSLETADVGTGRLVEVPEATRAGAAV